MVNAGLPSIRDTGIAAFLIAGKRMKGQTVSDILNEFPMLEKDDIEEAVVSQLYGATSPMPIIAHGIRGSAASISNLGKILLEDDDPTNLIKEFGRDTLIGNLTKYSNRISDSLEDVFFNYHPYFDINHEDKKQVNEFTLNMLIEAIREFSVKDSIIFEFQTGIDGVTLIGNRWLIVQGIRRIAARSAGLEFSTRINLMLERSKIRVSIQREHLLIDERPDFLNIIRNALLSFHNPVSVGSACLVRAGLHPTMDLDSTGMNYQFEIPTRKPTEDST
jgi:hypothetical protein